MRIYLKINKLFAYSENQNKYFYTNFDDGVNIIYGKNTSGKSTVFQSILYAFGINDNNDYLKEILDEEVFFRVDCSISKGNIVENVIFIRNNEMVFIKRENCPVLRFSGINGDNSAEHVKLKEYMHELFEFKLKLENKNEYKTAPIETMFLPYYISQSVGWVYLRKSFSSLDFYRNFKEDYLDYYLGIVTLVDREKKHELEQKLKNKDDEIKFYTKMENNNDDFQITKLTDEQFIEESIEYVELHKDNRELLNKYEEEYISNCNKQSYFQKRLSLLRKVSKNHKTQNPISGVCPMCDQTLPFSFTASYKYLQEENDTKEEMKNCNEKIKKLQSEINSLRKAIDNKKIKISKDYEILTKGFKHNISYDSWMKNKSNIRLISEIKYKMGELASEIEVILDDLKAFKTEEEVGKDRLAKSNEFSSIFASFLTNLGVKALTENRYKLLYQISAFPYQGVELHKTVLAYNFAFNKLIEKTEDIQRFPFMLDAIFKEDIEQANKNVIAEFIGKYKPNDTQIILSIAEIKENEKSIYDYNREYFNGAAKLICIGEGINERAFLNDYYDNDDCLKSHLEETINIINGEEI